MGEDKSSDFLGCYTGNWKLYKNGAGRKEKVRDGAYKLCMPMKEDAPLPFVEPNADTGRRFMSEND